MIISEISKYYESEAQTNVAPFIYQQQPATHVTAPYWIDIFGAADESILFNMYINDFIRDYYNNYSEVNSLLDCIDTEQSFFWLSTSYILYNHYEHDYSPFTDNYYEYGRAFGFNNKFPIYIDDVFYDALMKTIPSIAQQQDLVNYEKLAGMTGSIEYANTEGQFDEFIDTDITGTKNRLYYLDAIYGIENYTRSQLVSLASYFIEDDSISLNKYSTDLQDLRFKQNIEIPIETFNTTEYPDIKDSYVDNIIPLLYGQVRRSEAIPIDGELGTGNDINFRQALILTSLGTVQVEIDDQWTTKTPTATNLTLGEFTLAEVDGRKANGEPYNCRVVDSIGIPNTYSSDIIIDMNERFINVSYNNSLYDISEWESEEIQLESIGIVFNKPVKLYEAIRMVQAGSNVGFRYEIAADGRRTIRIDDPDRTPVEYIIRNQIKGIIESSIETNKKLLSAIVKVKYSKDYNSDKYLSVTNSDYQNVVLEKYREQPTVEIETDLITQVQAEARAELYASRFSNMPRIVPLNIMGIDYYTLRIYDVIEAELTLEFVNADTGEIKGDREFFGVWKIQVLSIDPDFANQGNNITGYLVEQIEPINVVRISEPGVIRMVDNIYKRKVY
ncbi:hypothetical protein LCGC14_0502980 [marine sediment metagenome]|uniref:Uncharacterized protein n=1 Tax=marine sediment metagenome TaxID=412755 RepID=A0A0F9S3G4_9ZZZZ